MIIMIAEIKSRLKIFYCCSVDDSVEIGDKNMDTMVIIHLIGYDDYILYRRRRKTKIIEQNGITNFSLSKMI